uniref:Uncharacterized protein n=1 Tax=Chromera velia CCMP2878 TaxID=1169474 RepID=A0A0G4FZC7_9ALVE|eukprot:Cvel_19404.t1-p1 / transcript=Cvel_19404.t1 / gene=Cvel_19404 / organism=Chromera_velia_CCMP2878 / gene_product=hypothetical protein / transcript_product=hypothetical protein / location=Cvel_scaffold1670:24149-28488(-) / protein_length=600 / sequence_SO=supercontig / SO=protein_coding / is_pseudo=false
MSHSEQNHPPDPPQVIWGDSGSFPCPAETGSSSASSSLRASGNSPGGGRVNLQQQCEALQRDKQRLQEQLRDAEQKAMGALANEARRAAETEELREQMRTVRQTGGQRGGEGSSSSGGGGMSGVFGGFGRFWGGSESDVQERPQEQLEKQRKIEALTSTVARQQQQISDSTSRLRSMQREHEGQRSAFLRALEEKDACIKRLAAESQSHLAERDAARESAASLREEMVQLTGRLDRLTRDRQSLRQTLQEERHSRAEAEARGVASERVASLMGEKLCVLKEVVESFKTHVRAFEGLFIVKPSWFFQETKKPATFLLQEFRDARTSCLTISSLGEAITVDILDISSLEAADSRRKGGATRLFWWGGRGGKGVGGKKEGSDQAEATVVEVQRPRFLLRVGGRGKMIVECRSLDQYDSLTTSFRTFMRRATRRATRMGKRQRVHCLEEMEMFFSGAYQQKASLQPNCPPLLPTRLQRPMQGQAAWMAARTNLEPLRGPQAGQPSPQIPQQGDTKRQLPTAGQGHRQEAPQVGRAHRFAPKPLPPFGDAFKAYYGFGPGEPLPLPLEDGGAALRQGLEGRCVTPSGVSSDSSVTNAEAPAGFCL